ncbi:peptidase inhibitor [Pseudomonas solani]|uniref:Peptidase inhibitor n=1 Tax=Pseudomonas solani TaxID=2731552 RepID=A0ABN6BMM4_9PSED|nr:MULTISPECIES: protease inhibitor I42 family protein [Pseudomonas]EQM66595.1 hypothetical protein L682_25455 [Pseudomonas alcaligenes OT 69]MBB4817392.1 inhibitor of cysteine peptidase [Pseudomonas alcaligenes]MDN4144731.1 protease inhibitor I42 family protein [Pseudomonas tohonis]MDU9414117.1 protease inhibitor I42 family protein [Pseudomonas sp. zfem005]BCD84090.1 peptidase inhibitor [Pseudomonas solani]
MSPARLPRLLLPAALMLLAACAHESTSLVVQKQSSCPIELDKGQLLVLTLPSNPTTGFRWVVKDAAPGVLRSLGPEVYDTPEEAGLVGGAGESTWRFNAAQSGEGRLLLVYQRPWEADVAPEQTFDCKVSVD